MDDDAAAHRLAAALVSARDAVVSQLDGLSDYDVRRPLTPTSTNLLGLVKHLATWESRYLGEVFDRSYPGPVPRWDDLSARGSDMVADEHETRADVLGFLTDVAARSQATIAALPLDAPGAVPWWTPPEVTLHAVLVHLVAEANRHAGHADILREQIDGSIGSVPGGVGRVADDGAFWADRFDRVERAARAAAGLA